MTDPAPKDSRVLCRPATDRPLMKRGGTWLQPNIGGSLNRVSGLAPIALLASATSFGIPATAEEFICADRFLSVEALSVSNAGRVCESAQAAKEVLASCGLKQAQPVTIQLQSEITGIADYCAGVYFPGEDRITLVRPTLVENLMPPKSAFAGIDPDIFFDSLIVHELAHAFIDQKSDSQLACSSDSEYIAYALQIESLPEFARDRVLAFREFDRPVPTERLNEYVLGFAPDIFGILAWTHFSDPSNGCGFISALLAGEITLKLPDVNFHAR